MAHNSYTMSTHGLTDMYNLSPQAYMSGKPFVPITYNHRCIKNVNHLANTFYQEVIMGKIPIINLAYFIQNNAIMNKLLLIITRLKSH